MLFCGHCGFSSLRGSCSFCVFILGYPDAVYCTCMLFADCVFSVVEDIVDKNNRMTRKNICQIKQGARRTMTIIATMTRTITLKDNHENNNSNNSNSTTKSLSLVMSIIIKTQNQKKQKAKQWWLRVLGATPLSFGLSKVIPPAKNSAATPQQRQEKTGNRSKTQPQDDEDFEYCTILQRIYIYI